MASTHTYDDIAEELASYIEDTAQQIAGAMREGRSTPFNPSLTQGDTLEYYRVKFGEPTGGLMAPTEALTTPDGQRIGPLGISAVYRALAKALPPPAPLPQG